MAGMVFAGIHRCGADFCAISGHAQTPPFRHELYIHVRRLGWQVDKMRCGLAGSGAPRDGKMDSTAQGRAYSCNLVPMKSRNACTRPASAAL